MKDLPKRKHPRLKSYDYSEQGLYFITICVKNREKLLCKIVGRDVLDAPKTELTAIGKIVEKYINSINNASKITVEKYVIMPDHIHLMVFVENEDYYGASGTSRPTHSLIPRMVSGFKRLSNKEIGRNIWQASYYDHIIRDEKDYLVRWDYIENNPALWLLGKDEI